MNCQFSEMCVQPFLFPHLSIAAAAARFLCGDLREWVGVPLGWNRWRLRRSSGRPSSTTSARSPPPSCRILTLFRHVLCGKTYNTDSFFISVFNSSVIHRVWSHAFVDRKWQKWLSMATMQSPMLLLLPGSKKPSRTDSTNRGRGFLQNF